MQVTRFFDGGGDAVLKRITLAMVLAVSIAGFTSLPVHADDPTFVTIGAGAFDFNRQKDQGAEFRVDYRTDYKLGIFKPFLTGAVISNLSLIHISEPTRPY